MILPKFTLTLCLALLASIAVIGSAQDAQDTEPAQEGQPRGVQAQNHDELLTSLLQILRENPRYIAAQSAVNAAEAQLSAAYNPASLEVRGDYNTTDTDPTAAPEVEPQQEGLAQTMVEPNATQLSANATFRPFPFGDTKDLVQQQELALESAVLDFREAVTGLENQALRVALQFSACTRVCSISAEHLRGRSRCVGGDPNPL